MKKIKLVKPRAPVPRQFGLFSGRLHLNLRPVLRSMAADLISCAKAPSMFRVAALVCISFAIQTAAMAEEASDAKQDTVEVHGKALQLSCAEWKRNQDGSWTSIGALLVGTDTLTNVTLRGARETKALEEKCQTGSTPAAAPAQSGDLARHTKRRNHRANPADGT